MTQEFEKWSSGTKILIILAHPDDPEFFLGGTIASWTQKDYDVNYVLLTKGEKGTSLAFPKSANLANIRMEEQRLAAACLGVKQVEFLDFEDGLLVADLETRKKITMVIRQVKPDILVSCDPQNLYVNDRYLNHPDHRAAGQVVIDAAFPAVGNDSFYPDLSAEGLPAHKINELWLSLTANPNLILDVDDFWERRKDALLFHKSQIGEIETFISNLGKRKDDIVKEHGKYVETFRIIKFRR